MRSRSSDPHTATVQARFGEVAEQYATSEIHASGASLQALLEEVRPRPTWTVVDVATGAGHAGFIFAEHVEQVIAVDVTEAMLHQALNGGAARGLTNLRVVAADAACLPFATGSIDLVTCRLAFHHFQNQPSALAEGWRVLKPGGILGLADNITVDEPAAAEYYNTFERIRDPSHYHVHSVNGLEQLTTAAGFEVDATRRLSKEIEFDGWADRQRVSTREKAHLIDMLERVPDALAPMLAPRSVENKLCFTLWEAVIVARSTRS